MDHKTTKTTRGQPKMDAKEAERILDKADRERKVIGLKQVAGVELRRDIDELILHYPDTFNLFLLALSGLMNDPDWTNPMSYFQIAGRSCCLSIDNNDSNH